MFDLDALCAAANARLRHSIATSAGMHKRQVRLRAQKLLAAVGAVMHDPDLGRPRYYRVAIDVNAGEDDRHVTFEYPAGAINLAAGEI